MIRGALRASVSVLLSFVIFSVALICTPTVHSIAYGEENEAAEAPEQKRERKKVAKKAKIDGDAINAKVASKFETPEE